MPSAADLLALDLDELAEALVAVAQSARKLSDNDRIVELADLLSTVRSAADEATGPSLALLEVSEAFLRALARTDLGKAEIALRRFAMAQSDGGAAILRPLAEGRPLETEGLEALGDAGRDLINVGVLRALPGGKTFDLRPSLRALARDLVEPVAFRMWRRVDAARGMAGIGRMNPTQTAAYLAGELGVTTQQAAGYLRSSPLTPRPIVAATTARRAGAWRSTYTREDMAQGLDATAEPSTFFVGRGATQQVARADERALLVGTQPTARGTA